MNIFFTLVACMIFPLADEFREHPPERHKFSVGYLDKPYFIILIRKCSKTFCTEAAIFSY